MSASIHTGTDSQPASRKSPPRRRRPTNPLNMKPQTCRERIFPIVRRPASAERSQLPIGGQVPSFPELLPRCPRVGKTTPPLHACWPMLPSVKSKPIRHAPAEDFKLLYAGPIQGTFLYIGIQNRKNIE